MYTEEKNEFPIKDLLVKVLILAVFVFILLWLFPIGRNKQDDKQLANRIFIENIEYMKQAAKNHYLNDKLPKTVGEKASMTLKQMQDNKLIIAFTDSKGKPCNETTSYAEITNLNKEYSLKVYLSCDNQADYVIELIGEPTDSKVVIEDEEPKKTTEPVVTPSPVTPTPATPTKTTKTVTEYEYQRVLSTTYTWSTPSAWTDEYKPLSDTLTATVRTVYIGQKNSDWSNWSYTVDTDEYDSNKRLIKEVQKESVQVLLGYDRNSYKEFIGTVRCLNPAPNNSDSDSDCRKFGSDYTYQYVTKVIVGYDTFYEYKLYQEVESSTPLYGPKDRYRYRTISYTDWVLSIPAGYETYTSKKQYQYSSKIATVNYEYCWSTNSSLGNNWAKTGKTRSKQVVV